MKDHCSIHPPCLYWEDESCSHPQMGLGRTGSGVCTALQYDALARRVAALERRADLSDEWLAERESLAVRLAVAVNTTVSPAASWCWNNTAGRVCDRLRAFAHGIGS